MTAEKFAYYLLDASKLEALGYQDLESLIAQYPYCQNLRFLICKKSQIEHHPDFERWLHLAATYSTDRSFLYQLLMEEDLEKQEILERLDLDAVQPSILTEEKEEQPVALLPIDDNAPVPVSSTLAMLQAQQQNRDFETPEEEGDSLVTFDALLEDESVHSTSEEPNESGTEIPEKIIEIDTTATTIQEVSKPKMVAPLPKTAFKSYIQKIEGDFPLVPLPDEATKQEYQRKLAEKQQEEQEKKEKKAAKKKKEALIAFAEESLKEKDDAISETLARILALQGHNDRAIAMYEKLKLQIPEKSAYFAAQIENLKIS